MGRGGLDRVAQVAERKYCRPQARPFRRRYSAPPGPARYLVAGDYRLPALRDVHLLVNVLHRDVLVSARSLALKREQALLTDG